MSHTGTFQDAYPFISERWHATVHATRFSVGSLLIWRGGFASCEYCCKGSGLCVAHFESNRHLLDTLHEI